MEPPEVDKIVNDEKMYSEVFISKKNFNIFKIL